MILKWDMKQDKASECDVSVLIHKAVIDKTKPFKTNIDNYVQQQDGDYDAFDVNLTINSSTDNFSLGSVVLYAQAK